MAPVILEMEVHCDGCARKIEKAIKKIDGVAMAVACVGSPGKVVVQGTADAAAIQALLKAKIKRDVVIVSTGVEPPAQTPAAAADPQAPPPAAPQQAPPPAPQPPQAAPPAAPPQQAPPPVPQPPQAAPPAAQPPQAAPPAAPHQQAPPPAAPPQYGGQYAPPYQYGGPPQPGDYRQHGAGNPLRYPPSYFSDEDPNGCSIQ